MSQFQINTEPQIQLRYEIPQFGHTIQNPRLISERSDKDGEAGDPVVPVHDLGELGGGDAYRKLEI